MLEYNYAEAIKTLKSFIDNYEIYIPEQDVDDAKMSIDILNEVAERETPMKVTKMELNPISEWVWVWECPYCGVLHQSVENVPYCSKCGQKLDWNRDE